MINREIVETRKVKLSCVTIGPHELKSIAILVYDEAKKEKCTPDFTIDCRDESSFITHEPATFEDDNIPIDEIESVRMSWSDRESSKSISIWINHDTDFFGPPGSYIEVGGTDSTWVNGITAKFQKLIIQYRNKHAILYRYAVIRWILLYLLLSGIILLLFWLWLAPINDEWSVIALPVSLSLGYAFTTGLDILLRSTFPNIEIKNARGSRAENRRKALYWIIAIIVLPILASITAGLIIR